MLYPIMPLYLAQIGYGGLFIGLLEGLAELIAGFTKIYTGSLSDTIQRRLPFVNIGYSLSVISRPLIVWTQFAATICLGRSLDKIGKGIRTSARDALLADECSVANRAEIFGFHRSMDTIGAILGPLAALLYLHFHPEDYKNIFFIAVIPGLIAVCLSFFLKEKNNKKNLLNNKAQFAIRQHFSFYKIAPVPYLIFLGFVFVFALVNSSDMFLLLRAKESGMSESEVLMLYIYFNLVFSLMAFPIGKIADRMNKHHILSFGFVLYALAYFIMAISPTGISLYIAFTLYGLFYAFTQGILKVLLIEKVPVNYKSNAVGFYEGLNSILLLVGNAFAGFIWYQWGATTMLTYTALITAILAVAIFIYYRKYDIKPNETV
jgi:MFS family permease